MVTPSVIGNMPTGGGWGLRFFPRCMIRNTIRTLNGAGSPAVLFLHPRDVDPSGPRLQIRPLKKFVSYGPRNDLTGRLTDLLRRYRFATLKEMVEEWNSVQ